MSYGDILLMILTSQKALASGGSQCLFYLLFCCKNKYNYSTNKLQVQKYVRLSHEFRAYIFVTFIGGIDPFCEPAAGDEIVYL